MEAWLPPSEPQEKSPRRSWKSRHRRGRPHTEHRPAQLRPVLSGPEVLPFHGRANRSLLLLRLAAPGLLPLREPPPAGVRQHLNAGWPADPPARRAPALRAIDRQVLAAAHRRAALVLLAGPGLAPLDLQAALAAGAVPVALSDARLAARVAGAGCARNCSPWTSRPTRRVTRLCRRA